MAVYIKPPKGNINLAKLCTLIKKRLLFLYFIRGKSTTEIKRSIDEEKYLDDFDCLIEGSMKDKISHFVLRFLCSANYEMKTFFIQSETELFKYRLEFYSEDDLKNVMSKTYKQCKQVLQCTGVIKPYRDVLKAFVQLVKDFETEVAEKSFLKELKNLLTSFFEEFLYQGILQTKSSPCCEQFNDPRFSYMMNEIKLWFKSNVNVFTSVPCTNKIITEKQLDKEGVKFPLCMKNIHLTLRKTHRLPHNARIQYILFLKEIGVPYQEVLSLFMKEYSFPMSCSSICNHSWNESKSRYTYSIQHLFGMRGSRKNYIAHSCHSLQCCDSRSVYEGGCPFSCFDGDNISQSLLSENLQVPDIEDIMLLSNNKKYTEACSYFLSKRLQFLEQSIVSLEDGSSSCHNNSTISINARCNKQLSGKNILIEEDKFTSCHDSMSFSISRPSEFYFIVSNFMK